MISHVFFCCVVRVPQPSTFSILANIFRRVSTKRQSLLIAEAADADGLRFQLDARRGDELLEPLF